MSKFDEICEGLIDNIVQSHRDKKEVKDTTKRVFDRLKEEYSKGTKVKLKPLKGEVVELIQNKDTSVDIKVLFDGPEKYTTTLTLAAVEKIKGK